MLDRLKHATDIAKFKADQLLRVNRVQGEISNLRRDIQVTRDQLAGVAITLHRSGTTLHPDVAQLCLVIDRLMAQIGEREAAIAAINTELPPAAPATYAAPTTQFDSQPTAQPARPTRACPHCGFGAPAHAAFCPNCGKGLSLPAEPAATEIVAAPTPPTDTPDTPPASTNPPEGADEGAPEDAPDAANKGE